MSPGISGTLRQATINTVVSVGAVCILSDRPAVCAAIIAVLLAATRRVWHTRRDSCVALAGLLCGVALEWLATAAGLWRYRVESWAGLPIWVAVLWPTYMIGLPRLAEWFVPAAPAKRLGVAIPSIAVALEIVVLVTLGARAPWITVGLLLVIGSVVLMAAPSRRAIVILAIGAAFGVACEALPVRLGIWTYPAFPDSLPPWLAPGYAVLGLCVVAIGEAVADHTEANPLHGDEEHRIGRR